MKPFTCSASAAISAASSPTFASSICLAMATHKRSPSSSSSTYENRCNENGISCKLTFVDFEVHFSNLVNSDSRYAQVCKQSIFHFKGSQVDRRQWLYLRRHVVIPRRRRCHGSDAVVGGQRPTWRRESLRGRSCRRPLGS